ncbi:MAG: alpha/beta hydrolase-fold protein [Bacillota bacterium]|nr:MAG: hypothetical protein DIU70_05895 [Bacillota bacterium]
MRTGSGTGPRRRWRPLTALGLLAAACLLVFQGPGGEPRREAAGAAPAAAPPAGAPSAASRPGPLPDRWSDARAAILAAGPAERQGLARMWWERVRRTGTPRLEGDWLYFFYWGEARQVAVSSEVTRWHPLDLSRLPGTDLWAGSLPVPADAVFQYRLLVNGRGQPDPANPRRSRGFGVVWSVYLGPLAPGEEPPSLPAGVRRERWTLTSQILGRPVRVEAWIPPECTGARRCPALLAADGPAYVEEARLPGVVAGLAAGGQIPPLVAVGIQPPESPVLRLVELVPGVRPGTWPRFVVEELLPDLSRRLPVSPGPHGLLGFSAGAAAMLEVLLGHPDRFAWAVIQSPTALSPVLEEAIGCARPEGQRVWLTWGRYEGNIFGVDVRAYGADLARRLSDQGFAVGGGERPAGHTMSYWRRDLAAALAWAAAAGDQAGSAPAPAPGPRGRAEGPEGREEGPRACAAGT